MNIYKNWPNDAMQMLMEENENDMGKIGFLEVDDNIVRI